MAVLSSIFWSCWSNSPFHTFNLWFATLRSLFWWSQIRISLLANILYHWLLVNFHAYIDWAIYKLTAITHILVWVNIACTTSLITIIEVYLSGTISRYWISFKTCIEFSSTFIRMCLYIRERDICCATTQSFLWELMRSCFIMKLIICWSF